MLAFDQKFYTKIEFDENSIRDKDRKLKKLK